MSGFTFGAPTTGGLTFGSSTPQQANKGFQLPTLTPTATTASGLNLKFGAAATSTPTQPSLFGASAAVAPSSSFSLGGTPTPTTGFGMGTPATTTAPAFGAGLFNTQGQTSAAPTLSFNLGGASGLVTTAGAPATAAGGLNFNLGSTPASTAAGFASTAPTTMSTGLGGLATASNKSGAIRAQKEISPKEQQLPNEILQSVEQFKETVKKQKTFSSDVARFSTKEFKKVAEDIDSLNTVLNSVEAQLAANEAMAEQLKYDAATCLQHVEMAQRTQDTVPGMQYDNTAPIKYFSGLADQFEAEMQEIRAQIDIVDKSVRQKSHPDVLGPQDLALGMQKLHGTFVALAGRLQSVHWLVEVQKDTYLRLCRQYGRNSNPFDSTNGMKDFDNLPTVSPPKIVTGPTPFGSTTGPFAGASKSAGGGGI